MKQVLLTTTGTLSPVPIADLGRLPGFAHPTVDYNIVQEFSLDDISNSSDLQTAVDNAEVTLKDENGNVITDVSSVGIGPAGATGAQGAQGAGSTGVQGAQGSIGIQGSQGNVGVQGAQGIVGVQGEQGATGDSQWVRNGTVLSPVNAGDGIQVSGLKLGATGVTGTAILDEDDMASDSDTALITQQSARHFILDYAAAGPDAPQRITVSTVYTEPHGIIGVDTTLGDILITLPDVTAAMNGRIVGFYKSSKDSNVVTVTTAGGTQHVGPNPAISQDINIQNHGFILLAVWTGFSGFYALYNDTRFPVGTQDGVMMYWDGTERSWKSTTGDILWDNTNKVFTVGGASTPPSFRVDADENIVYISAADLAGLIAGDNLSIYTNGRAAYGDSVTMDRLRANAAGNVPRALSLIDTNSVIRIWRFETGSTDPSIEFIYGTEEEPSSLPNQWWDFYLDGSAEFMAIRNRSNGVNAEKFRVYDGFIEIVKDLQIGVNLRFGSTGHEVNSILDEDDMASDSDTALATQQSIKAYVDSQIGVTGAQGNVGVQGPQGIVGVQGNQGNQGNQGFGFQGAQGFGSTGLQGATGLQGNQGLVGLGAQGPQGQQGLPGGAQGFQGPIGLQGNQGPQGSQGNAGVQGSQGNVGQIGSQGNQGTIGPQGNQGEAGGEGVQGAQGSQGNQGSGDIGPQGNVGVQGNQGVIGSDGLQGFQGEMAELGPNAFDGYDNTGGTDISAGWTDVPIDTERVKDANYTHSIVTNNPEVTIGESGRYRITARASTDIGSGTARSDSAMQILVDSGAGFVVIPGTFGYMYNRTLGNAASSATVVLVDNFNAGDKIKFQCQRFTGSDTIVLKAGGSSLTIESADLAGIQGPQGTNPGVQGNDGPQGIPGAFGGPQGEEGAQGAQGLENVVTLSGGGVFAIWAEENGALGAGEFEWAYGNGADTPVTGGIIVGCDCALYAMGLKNPSDVGEVRILVNGVDIGYSVSATAGYGYVVFPSAYQINEGDYINFQTVVGNGEQPNQVVAWFGTDGVFGPTGATGVQGFRGFQGFQGFQGNAGDVGVQGAQGNDGAGVQGAQGNEGVQGDQGLTGVTGVQGNQGNAGDAGLQGLEGPQGNQGNDGVGTQGSQGYQGNDAEGLQGAQGNVGAGLQGLQGYQGATGTGGGNPTGATGDVQYNNGDVFGATSGFNYDEVTECLKVPKLQVTNLSGTTGGIPSTNADGKLQQSGIEADASPDGGSMLRMFRYALTPTGVNGATGSDAWFQIDGAQMAFKWYDGVQTYSVQLVKE